MRTELLIPFTFDTGPIEAKLEAIGEKHVADKVNELIESNVNRALPKKYVSEKPDWGGFLQDNLVRWLDLHSQEIIDEAALLMAQRGSRKKAWRDVLAEVREGREQ